MTEVEIKAGVCGFATRLQAASEDGQTVDVWLESDCPTISKLNGHLGRFDAYSELFRPLATTELYAKLAPQQRHIGCPVMVGVFKAIEAAAGLALPRDASITFLTA